MLGLVLAALFIATVCFVTATYLMLASLPDYEEDFRLEGLKDSVDVLRDSMAIPHISASSPSDAYFALGFVHAQDRLGQMLRERRSASGKVPVPRYRDIDPVLSEMLIAYAAGVNAWIGEVSKGRRGRGAPELLLYDEKTIMAWRPEDSLRITQQFLGNLRQAESGGASIPGDRPKTPGLLKSTPKARLGAWALTSERTVSNSPILAIETSGPLSLPSTLYMADLQFPSGAVAGATLPGVPFVVLGRSNDVAWALDSNAGQPELQNGTSERVDSDIFLRTLYRLTQVVTAEDAVKLISEMPLFGLETVVIDKEDVMTWPGISDEDAILLRQQRLKELDARQRVFSVDGVMAVQQDTVSSAARSLLPLMAADLWRSAPMIPATDDPLDGIRQDALNRLAEWNGEMDRFSPEPLIFWAWTRALQRRFLQDEFPAARDLWTNPNPYFLAAVLSNRDEAAMWCDNRTSTRVETCDEWIVLALDDALVWITERYGPDLSSWSWGAEHIVNLDWSAVSPAGFLNGLLSVREPKSGGPYSLLSSQFGMSDEKPFATNIGTNFQAVMSVSEDKGFFFLTPSGQSGHPLSRFYKNLFSSWMRGDYRMMAMDLAVAEGGAVGRSKLTPLIQDEVD